jgi:hypothetical protein
VKSQAYRYHIRHITDALRDCSCDDPENPECDCLWYENNGRNAPARYATCDRALCGELWPDNESVARHGGLTEALGPDGEPLGYVVLDESAPVFDVEHVCDDCLDALADDAVRIGDESEFSWSTCDHCGSHLGGSRTEIWLTAS